MLVLTRALNEAIMIGDHIEVTIVEVKGGKVRLGITAPATVRVHRKEVYLAIQRANIEASQATPEALDDVSQRLEDPNKKKGEEP